MKKANKELKPTVEKLATPLLPPEDRKLKQANEQLQLEIAEREWTAKALRTSEAELRVILAAIPDVIVVFNARGRYLKIAPTNPALLYKPATELIGRELHEVFEPSQAELFLSYIHQALETGQMINVEYGLLMGESGGAHGQVPTRWFAASISPMQVDKVIWVARDITQRKAAEEALREERNFVTTVLDTAGALVVVLDPQGRIIRFNRCCEQTTEYSAQEAEGRLFWDLLLLPEEVEPAVAVFKELQTSQCPHQYENYWVTKSGNRRLIAWTNTVLCDPDGSIKYIIATGIDITERQRAQAALKEAKEQLEIRVEERTAALKESNDQLVVEIVERKRAEKQLREHKEHLQELVKERTAELEKANAKLRQEIIERECVEQALLQEKELAQITLHSICDAVITTNALGYITSLNPAAQRLTGWPAQDAIGKPVSEVFRLVHEITREPVDNPVEAALRGNRIGELANPTLLIAKDGTEFAIDESVAPILASAGQIIGAVLVFHDVTEERALARQLSWQASHDALTGLINRREFEQHLKRALLIAQTQNQQHALCYLDLDRFKIVNDTCGHVAGDELLRQISTLLQAGVRKTDSLARLGGDEFAVLLHQCPLEQARRIANSLRESIQAFRFVWEDKTFSIGASIGLVAINTESYSLTHVLNAADGACYTAKEQGRNRVHVHQSDETELAQHHSQMQWVSRITQGFEENRFRLFFQPIVPITDGSLNREHYEVLLRLEDEAGDLVSPMAFIPAAERYNIMHTIDRWVIRTLFTHLSAHHNQLDAGTPQQPAGCLQRLYGINLSGATLNDDQFHDFLQEQFALHEVPPHVLCFEIPETVALANLTKVAQFIHTFKKLGCYFALDDFGSGTSSFAYLKNLPVDYLKIDGSFVKNVVDNPLDFAMIEAINRIAHVMGLQTIAEFVENDAILMKLRTLGVDYAQGYGIARPHPSHF
ncbi:bifunctional diguanylate cyclase/phosphodiesterase [Microcoleus sp. FACHB-672]|uniref:bifunctional diguanylate cyclase/phosphodiesterase n=1 Tax=Microcoleus sp. FACHB-672 TaxID=2692825 RepID=UPI001F550632|nr:bifunctional diguanylate cyclase/phosphodiesterase [Microcoleus sp. FACHB-672]